MNNLITAIGNPILNDKLKNVENINVIEKDIKYKEQLIEILNKNNKIDFLIISELIKGKMKFIQLIKNINKINLNIKIIVILQNENNDLVSKLNEEKVYKIYTQEKICINEIINELNKNNTKEIVNENKIKLKSVLKKEDKKMNNKIISIIGVPQVGKTTFITLLIRYMKSKKILIVDCDFKFKEIQIIFNSKKDSHKEIIKVNKNIDILDIDKKINLKNKINLIRDKYDIIIFDNNINNYFYEIILEISDKILFLIEPNLLNINKSKILIEDKVKLNKKIKDKIKIIINKNSIYSIDEKIIENIFQEFQIIGKIELNKKYQLIINKNFNKSKKIKEIINKI